MEVKLKNCVVKVKDELTWGDVQKIESTLMSGAKMGGKAKDGDNMGFNFDTSSLLESKYVAMECAIIEIIQENNLKIEFTRDWINELSQSEGEKVYEAIDALSKKNN